MPEYIDREALIKHIEKTYCADCNSYNGVRCRACGTGDAIDMIEDAADVAPVVRGRPVPDMPDASMKGACNMNETHYRNGVSCRKPRNEAEGMFYEQMSAQGWALTKRGWPDFFCIKGDDICVVEVKPRAKTPLKPNQRIIMEKLKAYGVKCYRWDPDTGLTEI